MSKKAEKVFEKLAISKKMINSAMWKRVDRVLRNENSLPKDLAKRTDRQFAKILREKGVSLDQFTASRMADALSKSLKK